MSQIAVRYRTPVPKGAVCLVPGGMDTPHGRCIGVHVAGGVMRAVTEAHTGQTAYLVEPVDGMLAVDWRYDTDVSVPYPEIVYQPHASRYTCFADALVEEVSAIAPGAVGPDRVRAIACATAERFTYGHPEAKFNDGMDGIPALGCGLTEGSCVDINTYFIASLRAAGIEAGYLTGFYFPAEKGDHCEDGHCWVVTRADGLVEEWDIAHHLKMGTRDIQPGLNPKPGFRATAFHSMGLDFPDAEVTNLRALIEPRLLEDGGSRGFDTPEIRLDHPAVKRASRVGS